MNGCESTFLFRFPCCPMMVLTIGGQCKGPVPEVIVSSEAFGSAEAWSIFVRNPKWHNRLFTNAGRQWVAVDLSHSSLRVWWQAGTSETAPVVCFLFLSVSRVVRWSLCSFVDFRRVWFGTSLESSNANTSKVDHFRPFGDHPHSHALRTVRDTCTQLLKSVRFTLMTAYGNPVKRP